MTIPSLNLPGERRLTACECGRMILFARTEAGKTAPFDAEPSGHGRNVFHGEIMHALKKGEDPPAGVPRYVSHWATCPDAAEWRERMARRRREQGR